MRQRLVILCSESDLDAWQRIASKVGLPASSWARTVLREAVADAKARAKAARAAVDTLP